MFSCFVIKTFFSYYSFIPLKVRGGAPKLLCVGALEVPNPVLRILIDLHKVTMIFTENMCTVV
jgi:hypothetical protein